MRLLITGFIVAVASAWCQAPQYTIATLAGDGQASSSGDGGPASSASLNGPRGVTVDPAGNVYVTEYYGQRVRKIATDGTITTVAGNGTEGYSGDGGPATSAELDGPYRVTLDAFGNIYIADSSNNCIRKVDTNGIITTVAGNGNAGYSGDGGPATSATLDYPEDTAFDHAGNMYIADLSNDVIRQVNALGIISTVAGMGYTGYRGDGGPATQALLNGPVSVKLDDVGNLYISDQGNNVIRKVTTAGVISTYAGNGVFSFAGDGGAATKAEFGYPASIALDSSGNLYVPDVNNYRIRVVLASGTIWSIAGDGSDGYGGDGGAALSAELSAPRSVAVASSGKIYIGDFGNNRVRVLTPAALAPPTISQGGVVSASSFGEFTSVAPGSWIEIYGSNLASGTREWQGSDFSGVNAPTSLDGTSVTIGGQAAFVEFVSSSQVNVQVPSNVPTGSQPMILTTQAGQSSAYNITVTGVEPGFDAPSSFKINGTQYVVALLPDGTFVLPTGAIPGLNSRPAKPGETVTLYGVGFGPVTPATPAGELVEGLNTLSESFSIAFGGTAATASYDGLAPGFMGLYQFNLVVPTVAAGNQVPLTFKLGGVAGTQTLYTAVGN
ncbi:MAG TPA: IPT/TIG domain-containing protein [Bryobacteraceae bacterium]|nr:IPT/TIG domain-containing protein [Bryobacteraceae bacterium]